MGTETKMVKVADLVIDWNLWPRHESKSLDSTNVKRMKDALAIGVTLPPIIVNKADMRVVDGFHRSRAVEDLYGDDAEIEAILREYKDEAAMFLDAASLNAKHGMALGPKDWAHCLIKCKRMRIPFPAMAVALGMPEERIKQIIKRRTILAADGERIPVGGGAEQLAVSLDGAKADADQEHFARHANGNIPEMHARMLLHALKAEGSYEASAKTIALFRELRDALTAIIQAAK